MSVAYHRKTDSPPCGSIGVSKVSPTPRPLHFGVHAGRIKSIWDRRGSCHQTCRKDTWEESTTEPCLGCPSADVGHTQLLLRRHWQSKRARPSLMLMVWDEWFRREVQIT